MRQYGSGEDTNFFSRYSGIFIIALAVQSGDASFWSILGVTLADDCSDLFDFTTDCYINESAFQNKDYSLLLRVYQNANVVNYPVVSDLSADFEVESNYQVRSLGNYPTNVTSSFNNNHRTE